MRQYAVMSRFLVAVGSAALAACLSGCAGDAGALERSEPTGALSIVVGAHAAAPAPGLAGYAASARDMAVTQQSFFSVVVADGAPYVSASGALDASGETDEARQESREANRELIDDAVTGARARTPEVDLLAALRVAADSIRDQPGHRSIVVVDPGLSTTGALDFRQPDLLDAVPQEVADALGARQQLPGLAGISVRFTGLGRAAEPQAELSPIRQAQLEDLWTVIARTAGASFVEVQPSFAEGEPAADLPPVSTVAVPLGYACRGNVMTVTGGELAFVHGTDAWLDTETAERILEPLADQMNTRQLSAVLRGTTADIRDVDEQNMLSYLQAQAIANLWLENDVPQQQLTVVGLGSNFPGRLPERDAQGNLDPIAAAANRAITITFSAPVTC
ncbi:MAG TPA: OmpA family protein [Nocardioides sp.]|nr:OmpA family protein [Nocardioides sp.]